MQLLYNWLIFRNEYQTHVSNSLPLRNKVRTDKRVESYIYTYTYMSVKYD